MEKGQVKEVLETVVESLRQLEDAKKDSKAMIDAAFETYECSPSSIKAIMLVAKAQVKDNLDEVEKATDELASIIELVKE